MALIKTVSEVKKYVRVNYANNTASIPNMDTAARKYIVPIIGQPLYDNLQQEYDAENLSDNNKKLLIYVQATLAPLAYWIELPLINIQITDAGLRKPGTADLQPVYKHDYYKALSALMNSGMDETERLLMFLETNATDYPLWTDSDAFQEYKKYFIKNGAEFTGIYKLHHPRRCWLSMTSIMQMVEDFYINSSIGAAFAQELKSNTAPSPQEKAAIALIKKSIAYLSIFHATTQRSIELTDTGFTIQLSDPDMSDPSRMAAPAPDLERLRQEVEHIGQSHLQELVSYLNKTATENVFPTYFNSPQYKAPTDKEYCTINSHLKSSFFM